jgi:hypothetical protein
VLMYRKLSILIIDNFAIFGVIELSVFVAKSSISQYLNKILAFQPKVNNFFFNSICKRNKSDVLSLVMLEKLFKAMKTVPPTSIVNSLK